MCCPYPIQWWSLVHVYLLLNICNGVVLALDAQAVRLYCGVLELEAVIRVHSMQCEVVILRSYTHCNGDGWSTLIFCCVYGTVLRSPWTNRLYVYISVCLNFKLLFACIQCSLSPHSHSRFLAQYTAIAITGLRLDFVNGPSEKEAMTNVQRNDGHATKRQSKIGNRHTDIKGTVL